MPGRSSIRPDQARKLLADQLEDLARAGVTHLPKRARKQPAAKATPAAGVVQKQVASELAGGTATTRRPAAAESAPAAKPAKDSLPIIRAEVVGCTRCSELASTRTQTVFGVGNTKPRLVFMGEAPGADEDLQGEPFVGRAGQKLNEIITKGCNMQREDVYILNTLKCRPPGNRTPLPDEVDNCREYWQRQIALLKPEFICCLGGVAAQAVLETTETIGKLRKKFHDFRGIKVMCTYHPAYLLRNPNARFDVWEDIKMLLREMGLRSDN